MISNQIVLHIPHAAISSPQKYLGNLLVPFEQLQKETLSKADLFCDELFCLDEATVVAARYSRIVCDVERFADDEREPMSKIGQGLFYTHLDDGTRFRGTELRETVKSEIYDEHHRELTDAVEGAMAGFLRCLIIDCHSFSPPGSQPDICIGADEYHTPLWLVDCAVEYSRRNGYSVKANDPYAGSIVPMKYYGKNPKVSSIMIELNKRLYLTPAFEKSGEFDRTKRFCRRLLIELAEHF